MNCAQEVLALFLASSLLVFAPLAFSQNLSAKPPRAIVPFPPGGSVDKLARSLGNLISASTGQPVLVENRPGGAIFVGMSACAIFFAVVGSPF